MKALKIISIIAGFIILVWIGFSLSKIAGSMNPKKKKKTEVSADVSIIHHSFEPHWVEP